MLCSLFKCENIGTMQSQTGNINLKHKTNQSTPVIPKVWAGTVLVLQGGREVIKDIGSILQFLVYMSLTVSPEHISSCNQMLLLLSGNVIEYS